MLKLASGDTCLRERSVNIEQKQAGNGKTPSDNADRKVNLENLRKIVTTKNETG
jgi:hypothetical protein